MAAVPRSGTPEASAGGRGAERRKPPPRLPARRSSRPLRSSDVGRRRLLASAAVALAAAALFVAYLRVSRTYPENSDEANILLMSWDMLHGNVLLHGWYLSDVSFYPTELPQYALLEAIIGLHADTAHVAAAMTYTLVVLLAVLLARGRASGRAAWPPMALTACLMIAPQLGVGVFVLLLSVGHIGTAVPLMLIWLVIARGERGDGPPSRDREGSGQGRPARGYLAVPIVVGVLMTWVLVADPLVLVVGIVPLVAVCAVRIIRAISAADPGARRAALQARWYEVSLAAAAILAYGLAALVNRLLRTGGGFFLHSLGYQLAPVHTWPKHAWVTGEGLLALFGAKPQGPAAAMAFALLHLAGVAVVIWAMAAVARRFFSWPDLISQVLLVAIVLNVLVYVPSTLANATDLNAREFAVVLPFAAVLAGRVLGGRVLAARAGAGEPALARLAPRRALAPLARVRAGRRLPGQPRVRRRPAVGTAGQRPARCVPGRAPPDRRRERVLAVEHRHSRQRRGGHGQGRAALATAVPVGGQRLLV